MKELKMVQKVAWTPEEDAILLELVAEHGPQKWSVIAMHLEGRIGKQCRERWHNHLNPAVLKDKWSTEEDEMIMDFVGKHGTKWSLISKTLPGRTDNSIKNHYYSSLRKRHEAILSCQENPQLPVIARRRKSSTLSEDEHHLSSDIANSHSPKENHPKKRRRVSLSSTTSDANVSLSDVSVISVPSSASCNESSDAASVEELEWNSEGSPKSKSRCLDSPLDCDDLTDDWSGSDWNLGASAHGCHLFVDLTERDALDCPLQPLSIVSQYHSLLRV